MRSGRSSMKRLSIVAMLTVSILLSATGHISQVNAVTPITKIATVPSLSATTNGDILATSVQTVGTRHFVAIAGNFSQVVTPDSVSHAASNLAVLDQDNPNTVVYRASGINSYVRAAKFWGSTLYFGGDFTQVAGSTRNHVAAISTSSNSLLSWNPGSSYAVHAITTNGSAVFIAEKGTTLKAVGMTNGSALWSKSVSGGTIKVLMVDPSGAQLFVGGLFETINGVNQHGLMKLQTSNGANFSAFKSTLRADTNIGPKGAYDGEEVLSMDWDAQFGTPRLVFGSGGSQGNALNYVDPITGAYVSGPWGSKSYRAHEGDVQGLAVVGDTYVTGFHRSHTNNSSFNYDRFSALWSAQDGVLQTNWRLGLWGIQSNADAGNQGVQSISYDKTTKKLFMAGAFLGYGDVSGTQVGASGVHQQSLAVYSVQ